MIFKRFYAKLRAQDWMAIGIELLIVVVGVFIGMQVSNWNAARVERRDNAQLLHNLEPEIASMIANFGAIDTYYERVGAYAETAFAGWRGDPGISDRQFVVAAYQATQVFVTGINSDTWSQIFGSDRLRTIDDRGMRKDLSTLMTTDYSSMETEVYTDYRHNVRELLPNDVQTAIREQCGDRSIPNAYGSLELPATCRLVLPEPRIAEAAALLRAHPEFARQLNWHLAAIATYRQNIATVDELAKDLRRRLART